MSMGIFLTYILPALLTGLLLALPSIARRVELRRHELEMQHRLIEAYQDEVAQFIRHTDASEFGDMYGFLELAGHKMLDGTVLIESFLYKNRDELSSNEDPSRLEKLDSLTEPAKKALASAIGSMLLISSLQSQARGEKYRHDLMAFLKNAEKADLSKTAPNHPEIKRPLQAVYRFERAKVLPVGDLQHCR